MEKITPFKIEIPDAVLEDLSVRLKQTRWTDEPENAQWNYGTNPQYLRELVAYWQNGYDWRKQETELNKLPHFKARIDEIDLHFIHIKGQNAASKPLLLLHGWPDSFYRYHKVIPILANPSDVNTSQQPFDLVIPSIPGFGFSDTVAVPSQSAAALMAKLMSETLGYEKFYVAGGDLGGSIARSIAIDYPGKVEAIHLTDVGYPNGTEDVSTFSPDEQAFAQFIQQWWYTEGAYNMIQSTKPQTLGYALNDSPVGLASWILEKFFTWSDTNGNIENSFSKDELLTNIMIYWVTQTINSSIRTYLENAHASFTPAGPKPEPRVETPTGVAAFPAEAPVPKDWADRKANVRRFTKMPKGGHFAALEVPELWVDEVRAFFRESSGEDR